MCAFCDFYLCSDMSRYQKKKKTQHLTDEHEKESTYFHSEREERDLKDAVTKCIATGRQTSIEQKLFLLTEIIMDKTDRQAEKKAIGRKKGGAETEGKGRGEIGSRREAEIIGVDENET